MAKSILRNRLRTATRSASLLAYLAVLLTAPALDAVLEARTTEHEAHVEEQSDVYCSPSHDAYCQLCRILDLPATNPDRARVRSDATNRPTDCNVAAHRPAESAAPRPQLPRAPPIV